MLRFFSSRSAQSVFSGDLKRLDQITINTGWIALKSLIFKETVQFSGLFEITLDLADKFGIESPAHQDPKRIPGKRSFSDNLFKAYVGMW